MKRRAFLGAALGALAGGSLYGISSEPEALRIERIRVPVADLSSDLEGFRIVALSDFHLYPFTQLPFLKEAIGVARGLNPDLIALLGDFVDSEVEAIDELWPALADLDARLGVCAILGNHDNRKGADIVAAGLRRAGVEVLLNRGVGLSVGRSQLWVGGVQSQFGGQPDLGEALAGCPAGVTSVLLAHEPDVADDVANDGRVHLQLSGHSHGGQINVPGLVQHVLPQFGRKYPFGSYQVGDLFLHTSRGLGTTRVPVRFRSPPEVSEITLVRR